MKTANQHARQAQRKNGYEDTNWEGAFDRIVTKAIKKALTERRANKKPRVRWVFDLQGRAGRLS